MSTTHTIEGIPFTLQDSGDLVFLDEQMGVKAELCKGRKLSTTGQWFCTAYVAVPPVYLDTRAYKWQYVEQGQAFERDRAVSRLLDKLRHPTLAGVALGVLKKD